MLYLLRLVLIFLDTLLVDSGQLCRYMVVYAQIVLTVNNFDIMFLIRRILYDG